MKQFAKTTDKLKVKALTHLKKQRYKDALPLLQKIIKKDKCDTGSINNLAVVYSKLNKWDQAIKIFSQLLKLDANYPGARMHLANAFLQSEKTQEAKQQLLKIRDNNPRDIQALMTLANVYLSLGESASAYNTYQEIISIPSVPINTLIEIAGMYYALGFFTKAVELYSRSLELCTNKSEIYDKLAVCYCSMGEINHAVDFHKKAIEEDVNNKKAYSNYLLTLHYMKDIDRVRLLDEHKKYVSSFIDSKQSDLVTHNKSVEIKIGFVSADLRTHSVAYFAESFLKHKIDENIEVHVFSDCARADETTKRLRSYDNHWHVVSGLSDEQVYTLIVDTKIDILIDLAGHSSKNRLGVFAMRVAPLQMTYLGYPDTTGIPAMDYRIIDKITDTTENAQYCTEKLLFLDGCFLCYTPSQTIPEITELPATRNQYVTFGSFNNLAKINEHVLTLWVRVLKTIDQSRIIIKNPSFTDVETRNKYLSRLIGQGIDADRIVLMGRTDTDEEHLKLYNQIDIALDTFPYNGTTTTCEALWMGVPVITLQGDAHMNRVSSSLLVAGNLDFLIAKTDEEYIDIAKQLSDDIPALASIRENMRDCLSNSMLMDSKAFSDRFYKKLIDVFNA